MPEYKVVAVESNVDRLSTESVKRLLVKMVERVIGQGEDVMRAVAPKDTGMMASRVDHHGPDTAGDLIWADVGIPHIDEANAKQGARRPYYPGEQDSGDYPLFRARGTGIFGPASARIYPRRARALRFDGGDGNIIFRASVQGSPASHFLLDTFEAMSRASIPSEAKVFAEEVKHLYVPGADAGAIL